MLNSLPDGELEKIGRKLEYVPLALGQVLQEAGVSLTYVYFPTTAVISLQNILENGSSAEIAVVGRDGVLGISVFMAGDNLLNRAVVQSSGYGYRMRVEYFKQEFIRGGAFMHMLLRYTGELIEQISQIAICNRYHSIDQQLCRWLLSNLNRVDTLHLYSTQELIGNILGVRREGISVAAAKLQFEGLIHYGRGHIQILDRTKLEMKTCECYKVIRHHSEHLSYVNPTNKLRH